jgi:hypothetical protein
VRKSSHARTCKSLPIFLWGIIALKYFSLSSLFIYSNCFLSQNAQIIPCVSNIVSFLLYVREGRKISDNYSADLCFSCKKTCWRENVNQNMRERFYEWKKLSEIYAVCVQQLLFVVKPRTKKCMWMCHHKGNHVSIERDSWRFH